MTDSLNTPPQPLPDADSLGFWQATAEGRLAMCHCPSCGLWLMPPLERCRVCGGPTTFDTVSGTGTLYTFIVQWHHSVPGYFDKIPYVVGLIDIDEQSGVRIPARVVGIEPDDVVCGMRMRAEIVPLAGGDFKIPVFRPLDPASED